MPNFLWKETPTWRAFTDTTLQKYQVGKQEFSGIFKKSKIPYNWGHQDFKKYAVNAFKREVYTGILNSQLVALRCKYT